MTHHFVIIGGGPAGNQAATYAARLGARVTMIERDVVGGAAHLWDCIPSKTMIATGGAISFSHRIGGMGLAETTPSVDIDALNRRISGIKDHMRDDTTELLRSQGVEIVHGSARFTSPHSVATAILEDSFLSSGVRLLKGARATEIERTDDGVVVRCDDGRQVSSSHAVLAIGSVPNTDGLDLAAAGVEVDPSGYIPINHHCVTNQPHIYAAGDVSGKLPLSSVASVQGRKVAEHVMGLHTVEHRHLDYDKAASAIFTEPEIADVGLAEAEAFALGRKIRVTKVPFATTPKALINNDPRGFVKIISDPATGVVLGGSIVGQHAAELISVIALAVTANLT
ncbi:MAG: hypothetical protein EBS10_06960, partial [Acidimicrobiia bacterium]|nr:hypothetical protein [Acidimicrobiia bacterium]